MNEHPEFTAWWATAKLYNEFRGCTMPAAYAAWLAGRASIDGKTVSPTIAAEIAARQPPAEPVPAPKKMGKFKEANDGKG